MLHFIFKSIGVCTVAAIILTPIWIFNGSLERSLPQTTEAAHEGIISRAGTGAAEHVLDRFAAALMNLKREIRQDACRPSADAYFRRKLCPAVRISQ
jgi:hypothetical protein